MIGITRHLMLILIILFSNLVFAQDVNYKIGAGDTIRVSVYSNPDLQLETKVTDDGVISFPLIGEVQVAGETTLTAEKKIASLLKGKGYIKEPFVNIYVSNYQSQLVSVLGAVYKPGQFALQKETTLMEIIALAGGPNSVGSDTITLTSKDGTKHFDLKDMVSSSDNNVIVRSGDVVYVSTNEISVMGQVNRPGKFSKSGNVRTVSDFLALAGGATALGGDSVIVTTHRGDEVDSKVIDVQSLYDVNNKDLNIELQAGDTIFVPKAPMFYVYGEVQRPGSFKLEKNMTVMQALAQGGGPTIRGTQRGLKLHRQNADGSVEKLTPNLTDLVKSSDVLFVEESIF